MPTRKMVSFNDLTFEEEQEVMQFIKENAISVSTHNYPESNTEWPSSTSVEYKIKTNLLNSKIQEVISKRDEILSNNS